MSHSPPIPEAQRGRGPARADLSQDPQTRRERRSGVADPDFDPDQQGQSANLRQTDGRQGKTQDR
jgi:hypothetical protein